MKISATQSIFRQKTVIAKNNDPATTQVVQNAVQTQEQKKPQREATTLGEKIAGFIGSVVIYGFCDLFWEGLGSLIPTKPRK